MDKFTKASAFIPEYEGLEIELGHVPSYDEEQESEIIETILKQ